MRISRYIPGFRSGKRWKKIIASIFYCFVFICALTSASAGDISNMFIFINYLILPFIAFNLYGLIKKRVRWYLFVIPLVLLSFNSYLSQYMESVEEAQKSALPTAVMVVVVIIFVVVAVFLIRESKKKDTAVSNIKPPVNAVTVAANRTNAASMISKTVPEEAGMNTFAEVDLSSKYKTSPYAKEKIAPRKQKSPYAAFKEMRTFGRASSNYYGYTMYDTNSAETFCKQAEFMATFTDDCDVFTPCDTYYTTYAQMNDAQLRTYFTWRTKIRQGRIEDTSLSYAFCYIYELLNNIGVASAKDGIEKLIVFWTGFRIHNTKIDHYLPRWIKDYYVVNRMTDSFDFVASRFPVPYKDKGDMFDRLVRGIWDINLVEMYSRHKMTRMAFYKTGNQKVIENCLNVVFTALNDLFKTNGIDLARLYVYVSQDDYYTPFQGAVYTHKNVGDLSAKLNDYESYNCKNGKWSVHEYAYTNFPCTKGYILKTVEIEIRKSLGGKKGLNSPKFDEISVELRDGRRAWSQVKEWRKKAYELLKSKEFGQVIANAAQTYSKTANIIVKDGSAIEIKPVEIDLSKLDKIREEHEETAKKLIIEEYLEEELNAVLPPQSEQTVQSKQTEDTSGFIGLANSLNKDEKELLGTLLKSEQIPANCELLVEAINEKALEAIGDNIIEYVDGRPCVYDEYEDELMSSLGGNI